MLCHNLLPVTLDVQRYGHSNRHGTIPDSSTWNGLLHRFHPSDQYGMDTVSPAPQQGFISTRFHFLAQWYSVELLLPNYGKSNQLGG